MEIASSIVNAFVVTAVGLILAWLVNGRIRALREEMVHRASDSSPSTRAQREARPPSLRNSRSAAVGAMAAARS